MIRLSIIRYVLVAITILFSCSSYKDIRLKTKTNILKIEKTELPLNTHFKNGDYIISINDSIGKNLIKQFENLPDFSLLKTDTIDLKLLNQYWTTKLIKRKLRECFELNQVKVYYLTKSKYLYKVKRTVSKSEFKGLHNFYIYKNIMNNDTILSSYSFDTGTPPF